MAFLAFWIAFGIVGVAIAWAGYRGRVEAEKTIRQAIEKGVIIDAAMIASLKESGALSWAQRLTILGMISLFASAGLGAFALILSAQEPESLRPLLAIAAFVAFLGAGLLLCGWLLRRIGNGR